MKNNKGIRLIGRVLVGGMTSVFILNIILIILNLILGYNQFYIGQLDFTSRFSTDTLAFIFSFTTSFIVGGILGGTSIVFEIEKLSLSKATIIHFLISATLILGLGYLNYWIRFNYIISFLIIFIIAYVVIWLINSFIYKSELKKVNKALLEKRNK